MNGNIGIGGVLTGLPGSERSPRTLCAQRSNVPASQTVALNQSRYVNDGPGPLFIEQFTFNGPTSQGDARQTNYRLTVVTEEGRLRCGRDFIPDITMTDRAQPDQPVLAGSWYLSKPLVLLPKESILAEVQNIATAAINVSIAAFGYYESMPVPQKARYLPYTLHDQLILGATSLGRMREESLRNDGDAPFVMDAIGFSALTTSDRSAAIAGNNVRLKLGSNRDWMVDLAGMESWLSGIARITELPGAPTLRPGEAVFCEVRNAASGEGQIDLAILGYKALRLAA